MEWSKEQLLAINEEGKNILVSAGAGSGKTAVLTARILRKIKEGVSLNNLVVLTFTRAAALEMKERIKNGMSKNDELKSKLNEVAVANITTFDAYALSFVKRYHYVLKIDSDISLGDETLFMVKRAQILDRIFEDEYHNLDPKFVRLVKEYNIKSDDDLKKMLLKINDKLDLRVDKREYLSHLIDIKYIQNDTKKLVDEYFELIKDNILDMHNILYGQYYDAYEKSKYHTFFNNLMNATSYQEVFDFVSCNDKLPRLIPNSGATKVNDTLKDIYKKIGEMVSFGEEEELKNSFTKIDVYLEPMVRILIELDRQITAYKKSINLYQFIDIAKMGIQILEDNPHIRQEMRENTNEILIDEYQDTSNLQEQFINLFAANNVYMVGDIKQSIYRFRNANPDLFADKYRRFSNNDGGIKIDLNNNFRSRDEVVSDINYCFNLIMDDDFGGAKYKQEHQMKAANKGYFEEGKISQDYHMQVLNYEVNKENKEFTLAEQEAFIIGNDIKNKIDNGFLIFDVKKKEIHKARASDFAILIARSKDFDLYKRIFDYLKVPLNPLKDDTIENSEAIRIIKNIFKLIVCVRNEKYDDDFNYCFMSVGRSFLVEYSDDELFHYIKMKTYKESTLYQQILELSKLVINNSIDTLLVNIIDSFDIYHKLIKIGNVHDATVRIEYLLDLAKTNSSIGNTLEDFVVYVEEVFNREFEIKFSRPLLDGDAVRLMTIHKSKGLEFNIVYYPDFSNRFNIEDIKDPFNYIEKYGLIAPYRGKTPYYYLIKANYTYENISERIRLLYVALTRAKEKMIIVSNFIEEEHLQDGFDGVTTITKKHYNSFNDVFASIYGLIKNKAYVTNIAYSDIFMTKKYLMDADIDEIETNKAGTIEINNIDLPHIIKSKAKISKKISTLIDPKTSDLLEFGTRMHYILEIVDIKNPNLQAMNLSDYERKKVEVFLSQSIFKQADIKNVYHEYEFVYNKDNIFFHGIIDLIIERENSIDIIDYKLKNIEDESYLSQLMNYKKYFGTISSKPINIYLYSLIDEHLELLKEGKV